MILPPEVAALIASFQRELEALRAENAALRQEVAELRRRLDTTSATSSKPPSSDGLRKKPVSLRESSGRPSGGQKGHKGETLRQVAEPDRIVTHEAFACQHCGCALTPAMATGMERRQVFDLPERLIEVTEHRGLVYACPGCGGRTRAAFPAEARGPTQYGGRVRAVGVYLHAQQLIPEDRTAEALGDLIGAPGLCAASVAQWTRRKAEALAPVVERIEALIRASRVRCLDETGLRVGGRTQWLHTAAAPALTLYRARGKRGELPDGLEGGIVVHDGFKPYRNLDGATRPPAHALCNAHHLRELKALIEFDNEPWATKMRDCLSDACRAVGEARDRGETALSPAALQTFHARYWEAVREGMAFHRGLPRLKKAGPKSGRTKRRAGDNLLMRLHRFKDDVLRFLVDFDVPFTNNLAEQALRMMKVKMKISGGFRTKRGAQAFAALRSVIATARKQRQNILQTLAQDPKILANAIAA
jgi:transposase